MERLELIVDEKIFPEKTLPVVPPAEIDRNRFAQYADKAELMYTSEGGVRVYNLSEVTITASRKPLRKSIYYDSICARTLAKEEIHGSHAINIYQLFQRMGVLVTYNSPFEPPILSIGISGVCLVLDDRKIEFIDEIEDLPMSWVKQIDLLTTFNPFGVRSGDANAAIFIYTKSFEELEKDDTVPLHMKTIMPLGYQQPIEFYAPKYDTPEKRNASVPDLRTTIHWQPVVQTDSAGVASFDFYTADEQTSYTVVIEGLADDGRIIRQVGHLSRRNE